MNAQISLWKDRALKAEARIAEQRRALQRISRWHGEFPSTGDKWADGRDVSYGAAFGSNGERDYMRQVALDALASDAAPPSIAADQVRDAALVSAALEAKPLTEPVTIAKALLAHREARVVLSGGTGPVAAVHLVNIGLTGWVHTAQTARAFADGYNTALKQLRAAILDSLKSAPAIEPDCATCNGHGEIGGFVNAENGYQNDPCPDCSAPSQPGSDK